MKQRKAGQTSKLTEDVIQYTSASLLIDSLDDEGSTRSDISATTTSVHQQLQYPKPQPPPHGDKQQEGEEQQQQQHASASAFIEAFPHDNHLFKRLTMLISFLSRKKVFCAVYAITVILGFHDIASDYNTPKSQDSKEHIKQEAAINSKNYSDDFESPQEPSPTAKMANQILRSKGVLLRYDERHSPDRFTPFDQNGMDCMPASFVHASMQAPNVMFLGWPEEGGGWFEKGPRVSYLIGSKFEPEASCRAYYPSDAFSAERNHHIKDNPWGTSCIRIQKRFQNRFHDLYNVTNGCSCNYDTVPGKKLAKYFIDYFIDDAPSARQKFQQVHRLQCWYPGSAEGIRNLIHASNSLFHNRIMLGGYQPYWGWTECSGSPNIQQPSMIDALVIHLPHTEERANHDNSYFEDLDKKMAQKLKIILNRFVHLNLPVLLLQEKLGIDAEDCHLLWEGLNCEESYSKYFLSKEFEFEDGSCLARAAGDDEIRFYHAGSYNCTVNRILHEHNPLWEMFRHKASQRNEALHDADDDDGTESLVLVLTGDIHGNFFPPSCQKSRVTTSKCTTSSYGAPYLSHILKTIRSVDTNVVLLDSGDAFFGRGEGSRPDTMELIADTMNFLQYNVMALGNHETDYGPDALHKLRAMLQFPMIASNVKGSEVEALGIKSHIMIPIGKNNRHLCIVGVTAREVYPFVQNLTATPEITSVFETLKRLPSSCDRRIILSHAGIDIDNELVERLASRTTEMPRIDAILGGHSHIFLRSNQPDSVPIPERAPLLLHTNADGQHVGLLRLVWNTTTNSLTNAQSEILPLDEVHGVYPDDDVNVTNLVRRKKAIDNSFQKQRSNERRIEIIGDEGDDEILICGEPCRRGDCLLGQIITDSMRFCVANEHCFNGNNVNQNQETLIALLESGTVRSCFDADAQVFNDILPWPNRLVVLRVTGDMIVKFLQHGVSTKESSTRGGGFLQVSGLQYNFTEDYQLIRESICLDDNRNHHDSAPIASCTKALESDKTYMVVVTDWLAAGGDGYGNLIEKATVLSVSKATIAEAVSFYRESNTDLTYHTSSQFSRSFLVNEYQLSTRRIKLSSIYGIAGFIGGAISYFLTYPLYVLFVKKAVISRSSAKMMSWKLFDGVWLGLLATSLTEGIYFMIYGSTYLVQYPVWARSFVAAISNSVVVTPLWVVITWHQASGRKGSSIIESAREIYKVRGVYGFVNSLPFDLILSIYPILRQVSYEMILQHCIVKSTGYVSAGSAGTIASIIATITTYPIQKTRISWQVSPRAATSEVSLGLHAIATCKITSMYERLFSGIEYKLAHTCIRSFCLFFTIELIADLLKGTLVS